MELEGVVVMAEEEQAWEPSSDGRGFMVGVAKASVRSRLPLCRATGFGIRSLGPGAEKDSEKWGRKIPCQGGAVTPSPESRGRRAHEPQGEKLGCASWAVVCTGGSGCRPVLGSPGGRPRL